MGFLSDGARKAYRRAGGSAYVPDWYRNAIWVGAIMGAGFLLVTSLLSDNDAPPSTQKVDRAAAAVSATEVPVATSNAVTTLRSVGGSNGEIPSAALETARLAGTAIWNGDWDGVPTTGDVMRSVVIFPDAKIGQAMILSAEPGAVSLLFELDETGDGTVDQEFQVTVVNIDGRWVFPGFGG